MSSTVPRAGKGPRNGLLVRVGIDSTDGKWNAPARRASREFAYVTITEEHPARTHPTVYDSFVPALISIGASLPAHLRGQSTHLDPDFDHLTYGDRGQRGKRIQTLNPGDLLVFFAGLRVIDDPAQPLEYAIIGVFVIEGMVCAHTVPPHRWHENAHTRRAPGPNEIVVRARPGVSGRLQRYIPIGEYRNGAYRVTESLLRAWGGLDVKDGYLQRSARLPAFLDVGLFYQWFSAQIPTMIARNN